MIFQKRTYRLFPIALLFIQYTLFFPTIFSQKAWQEPFQVTQLSRVSKGKYNGYFQLDNFTKNEKKSLEKAKLQILHQLIFSGIQENTNLHLEKIKPIPFINPSALEEKEGQSAIFKFIELQGQEAIVSIISAGKTQSIDKNQVSWYIDVDMKKLVDLLESAQLKKSLNEIFGVKLKAIYYPKDLNEDSFYKIVNEASARSRYTEEFNLLKNEYGDQFEWLSFTDFAEDINYKMRESLTGESLNNIIISTLKADIQVEFNSHKVSSGMADQCNLIFRNTFDFREITIPNYTTLAGGVNQKSLLAGYLQNRSDSFDEVIQQSNTIYSKLLEQVEGGRRYEVSLSINKRLHENFHKEDWSVKNEEYSIQDMIEKIITSFSYQSSFHSESLTSTIYRFSFSNANPKLIRYDLDFQSALNQKMKAATGFQFDFVFMGNNWILLILTDLTKEERKIKMTQEFEKIQSSNTKKDFEDFLTEYPEFDRISDVKSLLKKIVDNDLNTAYQVAKSLNTFEGYRSFLIEYKQIENIYSDTIYSKVIEICNEMFIKLVDSNALQTNDYLKILNEDFIMGDLIILLKDELYESALPSNWKTINSLVEINKAISDLHVFLKNTFSKDRTYLLNHDIFTKMTLSTNEIESQVWTYANLNVSHFLNGDSIPEARTEEAWAQAGRDKKPAWSYFNNNESEAYDKKKLYNWYAITDPRGVVPKGYRIPSLNDYLKLAQNCGGAQIAGEKLKCPYGWDEEENSEGGDFSYFNLVPYGFHDNRGFLSDVDIAAFWTSTSQNENNANYIYFMKGKKDMNTSKETSKSTGFSVRIIEEVVGEEEENYSESMKSLELKRNELLLKEYSLLKKYEDIEPFLRRQLTKELELPESYMNEIDVENLNRLFNRFFNNEEVIKNGVYLKYFESYQYGGCGQGDGELGILEEKIGFVNNVQNYVLYEDAMNYKGEMENGSANGKGVLVILEDSDFGYGVAGRYEGMFEDSYLINGKITFKNKNIYIGQCQENVPNGTGKMILASGNILAGDFKDGTYIKPFTCKQAKIGNQVWMAENLNVDHFRNGDEIPEARTIGEWQSGNPAWCYYNNDPANASKYGKLYNPSALNDSRGLAPEGWHIPSHKEFNLLLENAQPKVAQLKQKIENAKNQGIDYSATERALFRMLSNDDNSKQIAAYTLRSSTGWGNENGTNAFGFNAFPSKERSENGTFRASDIDTRYWMSVKYLDGKTIKSNLSYSLFMIPMFYLYSQSEYVYSGNQITDEYLENVGLPVRCIKD